MLTFIVNETYSEITPESAESGDFSETGFEFEDQEYTLSELISYIKSEGYYREGKSTNWFTTGFYVEDYATCTEKERNLHITIKAA